MEFISSKSKKNLLFSQKKLIEFVFSSIDSEIVPDFTDNIQNKILFVINLDNKNFYKFLALSNSYSEIGYFNLHFLKLVDEQTIINYLEEYDDNELYKECILLNSLLEKHVLNGYEINLDNYYKLRNEQGMKIFSKKIDIMGDINEIWTLLKNYIFRKEDLTKSQILYIESKMKNKLEYVKKFYKDN